MNLSRIVCTTLAILGLMTNAEKEVGSQARSVSSLPPRCTLTISETSTPLTDSSGALNFVDQPVVASVHGGEMWFGSQLIPWPPIQSVTAFGGVLKNVGGTSTWISKPPHTQEVQMPMLINAADSTAHVVWAERTDTSIRMKSAGDAQVIKYSAFDGRRWSEPEIALTGRELSWTPSVPGTLSLGSHKFVATANTLEITDSTSIQLLVSRREGKQWRPVVVAESRLIYGIQNVRIQSVNANTILLMYSGRAKTSDGLTRAAIFAVRSRNAGATWDTSQLAWYLPLGTVPQLGGLHRQDDGSLHLFWAARIDGSSLAPAVMHQVSRDGGLSWQQADSVAVPNKFDYLLSAKVGLHLIVTVRQSNSILGQFIAGADAELQSVSNIQSPLLPVNVVRSNRMTETVWGRYQKVATRDRQIIGLAAVTHAVRSTVNCITK